jgi:hypothetical protein
VCGIYAEEVRGDVGGGVVIARYQLVGAANSVTLGG